MQEPTRSSTPALGKASENCCNISSSMVACFVYGPTNAHNPRRRLDLIEGDVANDGEKHKEFVTGFAGMF